MKVEDGFCLKHQAIQAGAVTSMPHIHHLEAQPDQLRTKI